ncbi:MAG: U32 family peptidase [Bacteroidales bacterium]|nr:U32 family peptidase [Bacteroidales bacterium]
MNASATSIAPSEVEVMAPAGSFEALMAAIQGGANAVYFGVGELNMRAKSTVNFAPDDLPRVAQLCRQHDLRSYLTVNTVLYDGDLPAMHRIMEQAAQAGISAVIVSDQAAMLKAHSCGLEVHLSTQLNISNAEALAFYAQWADVAVLARELSLEQVRQIADAIAQRPIIGPSGRPVKIEMFAHGALCMAISGKCYLSLHGANRSANRGACVQICRRSYTVTDNETGDQLHIDNEYIMSPKDLCTIAFIDKLLAAGVRVLKIEGRARGPEYVKTVTQCYSEAVQAIANGTYTPQRVEQWTQRLSAVFNRGFWDGYYLGRRLGEWSSAYGNTAIERKLYVGKVSNYFARVGVAEMDIEAAPLALGDRVLVIGPTTGVMEATVDSLMINDQPATACPQGASCTIKVPTTVRRADKLFKLVSSD